MDENLDYCRLSFERSDYYHYLISLYMPRDKRVGLWVLGAFKNVIEQIPMSITEPALGYMRLTWWRDQIESLEQGQVTRGQPILAALNNLRHSRAGGNLPLSDFIALINEHEDLIENKRDDFRSAEHQKILEKIMGADFPRYQKLENKLTAILKKHHGTKWEAHPPFLALRLWFAAL